MRGDTEGEPPEQGVCGLRNLGNTCYMNAGLQSLCAVRQFCSAFLGRYWVLVCRPLSASFLRLSSITVECLLAEMPILPSLPEKEDKPPRKWFHVRNCEDKEYKQNLLTSPPSVPCASLLFPCRRSCLHICALLFANPGLANTLPCIPRHLSSF